MKKVFVMIGLLALSIPAPGWAKPIKAQKARTDVKIVERDARGRATKVLVQGVEYAVCMNERQDSCIQPRQIGLGWGPEPASKYP